MSRLQRGKEREKRKALKALKGFGKENSRKDQSKKEPFVSVVLKYTE